MHIAHGARDLAGGDLQNLAELRHVEITVGAYLNLRVPFV
jgi:hypothetical protein